MSPCQKIMALLVTLTLAPALWAQSSGITYHGRLQQAGDPFSGTANLQFVLFDAPTGGSQVGPTETRIGWPVAAGLFEIDLDFGDAAFDGSPRFLEILVNGAPLTPRQAVRAAPVALYPLNGNRGPAGPTGPQGPAGPAGPQGPEGPAWASLFTVEAGGSIAYETGESVISFGTPAMPNPDLANSLVIGNETNEASGAGAVVVGGGQTSGGDSFPHVTSGVNSTEVGGASNVASIDFSSVFGGSSNSASDFGATILGGAGHTADGVLSVVIGGLANSAANSNAVVAGGTMKAADTDNSPALGGERPMSITTLNSNDGHRSQGL